MISANHFRFGRSRRNVKERNRYIKIGEDELYPGPIRAGEVL
jgi:hypothetical protein